MKKAHKLPKAILTNRQKWEHYRHTDRYQRARNKVLKGGQFEPSQWREKYGVWLAHDPAYSWEDLAERLNTYNVGANSRPAAAQLIDHPSSLPFSEKVDPTEKIAISIQLKHDLASILDEVRKIVQDRQNIRKEAGKPVRRSPKQSKTTEKDLVVWFVGVLMKSGKISPDKLAHLGATFPKSSKTVEKYRDLFRRMSPEKLEDVAQMLLPRRAKVIFSSSVAESQEYQSHKKKIPKIDY